MSWNGNNGKPYVVLPQEVIDQIVYLAAQCTYIFRLKISPLPVPLPTSCQLTISVTTEPLLLLPLRSANCLPSSCQALTPSSPNVIYIKPIYILQRVPDGEGAHRRLMCCFLSMVFS